MKPQQIANWNFPLSIPGNQVKKVIKNTVGRLALLLIPRLQTRLIKGSYPSNSLERAALMVIFMKLTRESNQTAIDRLHRNLWSSSSYQAYYDVTSHRTRAMYKLMEEDLKSALAYVLEKMSPKKLIEIGCGDGTILNHLSKDFKSIPSFIGLDINDEQIELNSIKYKQNTALSFIADDALDFIRLIKKEAKVVYLTFGGVLEYFHQQNLISLLEAIYKQNNNSILFYEPILNGFDPDKETESRSYGPELSFSHPYLYLLRKTGFKIVTYKTVKSAGGSWLFVCAIANPKPSSLE